MALKDLSVFRKDEGKEDASLSIVNPFPQLIQGPALLHDLVSEAHSEADALDHLHSSGTRTKISYSHLHSSANSLAERLQRFLHDPQKGGPNIIPVFIPQCPSLYISLFGILKAGAAFCPLNLDVPEERLKFILKDVSAKVILTTSELHDKLAAMQDLPLLIVDDDLVIDSSRKPANTESLPRYIPASKSFFILLNIEFR